MITFASLLGLMMVGSSVDFSEIADRLTNDENDTDADEADAAFAEEMPRFSFEDLLSGAVASDLFDEPADGLQTYFEDEAACDALADGELGEVADPVGSTLDDWLALTGDGPTMIDEYNEAEDALFVVYDAHAHPDPVLSMGPSDTGESDAMLMLDGMPLAVVSGGAGLDLSMVSLVPEAQFPMALAAGA